MEASTTTVGMPLTLQTAIGIPYVSRADGTTGVVHVWAPAEGGPWPVVVMLHGGAYPANPGQCVVPSPAKVAERGSVVFTPVWLPDSRSDFTGGNFMKYTAEALARDSLWVTAMSPPPSAPPGLEIVAVLFERSAPGSCTGRLIPAPRRWHPRPSRQVAPLSALSLCPFPQVPHSSARTVRVAEFFSTSD